MGARSAIIAMNVGLSTAFEAFEDVVTRYSTTKHRYKETPKQRNKLTMILGFYMFEVIQFSNHGIQYYDIIPF